MMFSVCFTGHPTLVFGLYPLTFCAVTPEDIKCLRGDWLTDNVSTGQFSVARTKPMKTNMSHLEHCLLGGVCINGIIESIST